MKLLHRFWQWFYTELPAHYSIPILAFVFILVVGALFE